MKTRVKLVVFWGAIITAIFVAINVLRHLLGGEHRDFVKGARSEAWGRHGDFGHHQMMYGFHHHEEFHWFALLLFLLIGLAVVILFVKWLRRKAKSSNKKQLNNTPIMNSHTPVINHNGRILDQWEQKMMKKKENE
jgi:fructose-specific phosphotransferase system IIC component